MLAANAGFLITFIAGNYLAYHTIPYIGIIVSIIFLAVFIFFPETPTFLLKRKKEQVFSTVLFILNLVTHFSVGETNRLTLHLLNFMKIAGRAIIQILP